MLKAIDVIELSQLISSQGACPVVLRAAKVVNLREGISRDASSVTNSSLLGVTRANSGEIFGVLELCSSATLNGASCLISPMLDLPWDGSAGPV